MCTLFLIAMQYVCVYVCVCVRARMRVCVCAHVRVHTCILYVHIYIIRNNYFTDLRR